MTSDFARPHPDLSRARCRNSPRNSSHACTSRSSGSRKAAAAMQEPQERGGALENRGQRLFVDADLPRGCGSSSHGASTDGSGKPVGSPISARDTITHAGPALCPSATFASAPCRTAARTRAMSSSPVS